MVYADADNMTPSSLRRILRGLNVDDDPPAFTEGDSQSVLKLRIVDDADAVDTGTTLHAGKVQWEIISEA